jgi:hypothetical protein
MKKIACLSAVILVLSLILAAGLYAQRGMKWKGSGGWGSGSQYNRMYDPKTVETISGEVMRVDKILPTKGMTYGAHMVVKTDTETISVHLGPAWYLESQDVKIERKDQVEITGSRITFRGKPAIIAAEVKKGEEVLKLRDEDGFPVWSGWRQQ